MKQKLKNIYYKSKKDMIQSTINIANNFDINIINNLINKMDKRVEELFNKNFDIIDY